MPQAFRFFDEAQQGSLSEADLVAILLAADDEVRHGLGPRRTVSLAHGCPPRLPGWWGPPQLCVRIATKLAGALPPDSTPGRRNYASLFH